MVLQFGLDRPIRVQFGRFVLGLFNGDFGLNFYERRPMADIYAKRLQKTLLLA